MSDTQDFANTPFSALVQQLAAQQGERAGGRKIVPHHTAGGGKNASHGNAPDWDAADWKEESLLFLDAMRKSSPARPVTRHGFSIGDHADMPKLPRKSKKSRALPDAGSSPVSSVVLSSSEEAAPAPPLSSEETDFQRAMQGVLPLTGKGRDVPLPVEPGVSLARTENLLQDFIDGKLEFALCLTGEYLEGHVVGLDEVTMNKLRAGQYSPETHVDLHGLNTQQAFQALHGFFRSSWYKGMRCVLVVPGRGRNSSNGFGVLRDKLQSWLTQEPFKRVVLAFCTARPADGGPGSVYVLLRKYRKKGKIYWERMPADPDLF